ncbi:MAG: ATP-grasp domain-containing protein, partial [Planctomycetes bacterium]|nr:ATP-grasp domain-containing protein [Planctomycetota bacterium]
PAARDALRAELAAARRLFPRSVFDAERLIVEQVIDGAEFAVDAYLDDRGEPVVLNLLEHVFAGEDDVSDRVYRTSPAIVERWREPFAAYLRRFGALEGMRGFSLHAELRVDAAGRITPIEVNPLRFGGFCTTAELTERAWGFDPYLAYLRDQRPDWPRILAERAGRAFHLVVLDNSTGLAPAEIAAFDYDRLLAGFSRPLGLVRLDHRQYPLFGFVVVETEAGDSSELDAILRSDLREFVIPAA